MSEKYTSIQNIQYFFVCLFFASLNFEVFSPIVENFSVAKLSALLYMGASMLTPGLLFSTKNIKLPLIAIWVMFSLMVISSLIHMEDNDSVFDTTLFLNIIMFWLLLNHQRRDNRVFHDGFLWFSISSFLVGVLYFLNIGVTINEDMRVVVFGENANGLGIKMSVGSLFLLNYCLNHSEEKPINSPWLLVMLVPMLSLLFATASRISILVLSAGVILFVLLRPMKRRSMKMLWLLLGIAVLHYGFQIVTKQEVLMTRIERTIYDGSVSGRDYIWAKYIDVIEEHPILGVGFHGTDQYALGVFGKTLSPHNVIIEVALYSGIFGLLFFLVFLFCVFKDAWLYRKRKYNLGPLIVVMAIVGMVMSGQALGVKLFWTIAAYAISHRVIEQTRLI